MTPACNQGKGLPMTDYKAIIWDFGGVITSSPFEAFNRYEAAQGLPENFIRTLNANNPDTNAWACLLYTSPSPRDGLLSRMPSSA